MCGDCLLTRREAAQMVLDSRDTDDSFTGLYHELIGNFIWVVLEAVEELEVDPDLSDSDIDEILGSIGPFLEVEVEN